MSTGLLIASNATQFMQTYMSTENSYARTSDAKCLVASKLIIRLVSTPISSTKRNSGVQQPKNHASDRKLLTLLGMPAGSHHLTKKAKM